jgi:hypothetical protein
MNDLVITNISIYKAIAEDAFENTIEAEKQQRTPKADGTGWIIKYDPNHVSFKNSIISVVFTGMWLEALTHLLIVQKFGEKKFREYDFKSNEEKLKLLGISDGGLLEKVKRFRETRKELVHEKAHFDDGTIKTAQEEARLAHEIMVNINAKLG